MGFLHCVSLPFTWRHEPPQLASKFLEKHSGFRMRKSYYSVLLSNKRNDLSEINPRLQITPVCAKKKLSQWMTFFLGFSPHMILHKYSFVICFLLSSPTPTPTTFPLISLWSHTGIYLTYNLIISRVTHTRRLRTIFKIGAFKTRHLIWFSLLKPKEKVWIKWNYLESRRLIRMWNVLTTVFFCIKTQSYSISRWSLLIHRLTH